MRALAIAAVVVIASLPAIGADSPPGAPVDLTATYDAVAGTVTLAWEAPDAGSYTYSVYRGTTYLGDTEGESYIDDAPDILGAYVVTTKTSSGEGDAALIVVPTTALCAPMPVFTRHETLYVTPEEACDSTPCAPGIGQGIVGDAMASPGCILSPCAPLVVWLVPPDVRIREECIPSNSNGNTLYEFQVVS